MRILVIGCGKFGADVIQRLSDMGNDVVGIDMNEDLVSIVNNTMDAMAVVGSGTEYDTLKEVEADQVDLCISCTNSDESTLLAAHLANEIGAKHTISVVRNLIHGSENAKFIEKSLNLDLILNPDYLASEAIYDIIHKSGAKNVMISGGHVITYYVTKLLIASGHAVTIVEKYEERCERLASVLPDKVNIVHADGSKHEVLEKEGLNKSNAFVAITGRDEVNILSSLYVKEQGIPTVVTKINNDSYESIVRGLSLDNIVSPRGATFDIILSYVESLSEEKAPRNITR